MNQVNYDFFLEQLKIGKDMDETVFIFMDDPQEEIHYLGYQPQYAQPYWVGFCDAPDGCEFLTAEELLNAPIYQGKSIRERWDMVQLITINEIPLEIWLERTTPGIP